MNVARRGPASRPDKPTEIAPVVGVLYLSLTIFELSPCYPYSVTPALFALPVAEFGCILVVARPNEAG